jgi:hypothetical protein
MPCTTALCKETDRIVRSWMADRAIDIAHAVFDQQNADGVVVQLMPPGPNARQETFYAADRATIYAWLDKS